MVKHNYTKKTFPWTHKLILAYPGLSLNGVHYPLSQLKGLLYNNNLEKAYLSGQGLLIDVIIPYSHLSNELFWEKNTMREIHSEGLNAFIYRNLEGELSSMRFLKNGKFLRIGDRVKINSLYCFLNNIVLNDETIELHFTKDFLNNESLIFIIDKEFEFEHANIVAKLHDGTILSSDMEDHSYYVVSVDEHKGSKLPIGPLTTYGYVDDEKFIKFKTSKEADEWVLQNRSLLSYSEIKEIFFKSVVNDVSPMPEIYSRAFHNYSKLIKR